VLVNQALADRYWPGEDVLGKRITVRKSAQGRPEFGEPVHATIVGVVGNVRHYSLDTDFVPEVYLPYTITVWGWMSLVVRTTGDPAALVPTVARAARSVEPDLPLEGVSFSNRVYDLPTSLRQSLAYRRFITGLLGAFAVPAVLLAALGIFGVVGYLVAQRGREIGIRMALGAQRRNVLTLVLGEGMRLAAAGVLLGTLGATATTRLLASELYETSPTDPLTFVLAALMLAGISLFATLVPARRAASIDPARTLQSE
jgi:putative ABC transport system permease protein